MRGGTDSQGYTIIEVMIFLAVSGLMFVVAAVFVNGKQAKSEFQQSINDINTQVQQVISDVGSGVSPTDSSGNPACPAGYSNPSGIGCAFYGELIQFTPNSGQYVLTPVTGTPLISSPSDPSSQLLPPSSYATAGLTLGTPSTEQLEWGMTVTQVYDTSTAPPYQPISTGGGIGFFGSLAGQTSTGGVISLAGGQQSVVVASFSNTGDVTSSASDNAVDAAAAPSAQSPSVTVCFSGGSGQYGYLTIGAAATTSGAQTAPSNQRLTTSIDITGSSPGGPCASAS